MGDVIRPSRDMIFMSCAELFSLRGTCTRLQVGAVVVKEGRIVSTGYVGSPPGASHCIDSGCDVVDGHCISTIHAEANAIASAARFGINICGSTLYCTHSPCRTCAKLIASAGIVEVVFSEPYKKDLTPITFLRNLNIRCRQFVSELKVMQSI